MDNEITPVVVPENERLDFWPMLVGDRFLLIGEATLYQFMERLCPDYSGGYWEFYTIPGGGFPVWDTDKKEVHASWADNYSSEDLSPEALSIAATLFTLSHLSFTDTSDRTTKRYRALYDWMQTHPEAGKILALID